MGIENLKETVNEERIERATVAELSNDQAVFDAAEARRAVEENDAKQAAVEQEIFTTRAEVEQKFADARDEIDAKYLSKVQRAEQQRNEQHSKNLEKRQDALGKVGLNPDGSNPHARPQATIDRDTNRVVDTRA